MFLFVSPPADTAQLCTEIAFTTFLFSEEVVSSGNGISNSSSSDFNRCCYIAFYFQDWSCLLDNVVATASENTPEPCCSCIAIFLNVTVAF